ncbi:DUF5710 domain-containing protein [Streptomyces sp. NPDC006872]|uniref:DUF5710 domain-containing protein n=1 Tax=Streptomyces sp. NPDC006872 TaxID=3155720 RepID=UPI0033F45EE0
MNAALHDLHKGAGLVSLSAMVRALEGAGFSRSTVYDAFASTRLPSWEVVDALVEVLATKHPQMSPEEAQPRFHRLWLNSVDEESSPDQATDQGYAESPWFSAPPVDDGPWFTSRPPVDYVVDANKSVVTVLGSHKGERIWLNVPFGEKDAAKRYGARWDKSAKRWYALDPVPELTQWRADDA